MPLDGVKNQIKRTKAKEGYGASPQSQVKEYKVLTVRISPDRHYKLKQRAMEKSNTLGRTVSMAEMIEDYIDTL